MPVNADGAVGEAATFIQHAGASVARQLLYDPDRGTLRLRSVMFHSFPKKWMRMAHVETLRSVFPGLTPMNPATAVCLAICGISLVLLRTETVGGRRRAGQALAGAAIMVGFVRLVGYAFGRDQGIVDSLMFRAELDAYDPPNRIAPNTALIPGEHEPRDSHSHERHYRHDRPGARHRTYPVAARLSQDGPGVGRGIDDAD